MKKESYSLTVVNGEPIDGERGVMDVETVKMFLKILGGHLEQLKFDVINIGRHDAILGTP